MRRCSNNALACPFIRAFLAACVCILHTTVQAQSYPTKPIRLINPYAAGGPGELLAREVATPLAALLGQQILVESRPGAGATLGADLVAKSAPDGYTLLLAGAPSQIISPAMQAKPAYDGIADFTPISMFVTIPNILVARPGLAAQSFAEFADLVRRSPGKLTYGSAGQGSIGHLAMEQLRALAGLDLLHVPYKGAAPVMVDLISGQIDTALVNLSAALPHVKAGKLRALAMATKRRAAAMPDLQTIDEAGVRGYDAGTWWALFGPAKLPAPIVATLYDAMAKVVANADVRARLFQQHGGEITLLAPDELLAHMRKEQSDLSPLIRKLGLRME
jgi:tripartite-type tricarboxylate transporter receptor subunit TctC